MLLYVRSLAAIAKSKGYDAPHRWITSELRLEFCPGKLNADYVAHLALRSIREHTDFGLVRLSPDYLVPCLLVLDIERRRNRLELDHDPAGR